MVQADAKFLHHLEVAVFRHPLVQVAQVPLVPVFVLVPVALVLAPVFVLALVALVQVAQEVLVVLVLADPVANLVDLVVLVVVVLVDQVADLVVQVLDPADPGVDLVGLAAAVRVQVDSVAPPAKSLVRVVAPSLKIFSLRPRRTQRATHLFRREPS